MARLAGYGGSALVADALIEDCEDVWNEQVDADVTASLDTSDYKVGSGSAKFVCAAGLGNGDIIASEVVSVDLSAYTRVIAWVKSSVNITTAADLQLLLDEHGLCASPLALDIPVLVANTWTHISIAAVLADYNATISVGLKLTANDPGAFNLWIDDIRGARAIAGIKSWAIDHAYQIHDGRAFDDSGAPHPVAGAYDWTGTFEGFKDGAPIGIGTLIALELQESSTAGQVWRGNVIIHGRHPSNPHDGLVAYSYDFTGSGILTSATA